VLLAYFAGLLALAGVVICVLGLVAVIRFAKRPATPGVLPPNPLPPVTVLKPLCGDEPLLEQALESCFCQDYPDFQIVFGVHDANDPALAAVERLRQRFPERDVQVVAHSALHGSNRKLSNLINMLPFAKHEILLISDSDLHVRRDYLEKLVVALAKPGAGLVTSLYYGRAPARADWAGALGASQINHTFLPGVLLSRAMGREDCLGSTAMFRRETLERIGGFAPLAHVLAEDNVLGQRIRNLGLSVELADVVPTAIVPEATAEAVWQHEIRWTRTIRELTPRLLCASTLQYPLFWSGLAVILAAGAPWSLALFLGCWLVVAASARGVDLALRDHLALPGFATPFWVFPLRAWLSVVEVAASFLVDEVVWRGHKLAASGVAIQPAHGLDGQDLTR
jgi:ceramide glucosyltransferase